MELKIGQKVKIYDYDTLKNKLQNGMVIKSGKFNNNFYCKVIFGIGKSSIDRMSKGFVTVNFIREHDFCDLENNFFIPFEFIKHKTITVKLPDNLFKM